MSAPPVRIESKAWTDLRYRALALRLGLATPEFALIQMATIWRWQTEHYTDDAPTYSVSPAVVEGALGLAGPAAIVAADLAEIQPNGMLRIRGGRNDKGKSRIDWLWNDRQQCREAGRNGGRAAAKNRAESKREGSGKVAGDQRGSTSLVSDLRSPDSSTEHRESGKPDGVASVPSNSAVESALLPDGSPHAAQGTLLALGGDETDSGGVPPRKKEIALRASHSESLAVAACAEINRLTGSAFESTAKSTATLCRALAKAKHTPDEAIRVIRDKHTDWRGNPEMRKRLVPSTLLALANFEKYLDELQSRPGARPPARASPSDEQSPPFNYLPDFDSDEPIPAEVP